MKTEITFDLMSGEVDATFPICKHRVIKVPGGSWLYRVEFDSTFDIILIRESRVALSESKYIQDVYLFDKKLRITHTGDLSIVLVRKQSNAKRCMFIVKSLTSDGLKTLGKLQMYSNGLLLFDNKGIDNKLAKMRYYKATTVYGR